MMIFIETVSGEKVVLDYFRSLKTSYIEPVGMGDDRNYFCYVVFPNVSPNGNLDECYRIAEKIEKLKNSVEEFTYKISIRKNKPLLLPEKEIKKAKIKSRKEREGRNIFVNQWRLNGNLWSQMSMHERINNRALLKCYTLEELIKSPIERILYMI